MNIDLSFREKILLVVLGIVAIVFIGAKLLIIPATNALSKDRATYETLKFGVEQAKTDMVQVGSTAKSLSKVTEEAKDAASPFFPSLDKPSLSIWLQDIAKKSGFAVESIDISDPVTANLSAGSFSVAELTETSGSAENSKANNDNTKKNADSDNETTTSSAASTSSSDSTSSATSASSSSSGSSSSSSKSAENNITSSSSTVKLKMSGSYGAAKSFLDAIKDTKRYVVVSSFSCKEENNTFVCEVTLQCFAVQKLDDSDNIFEWKLPAPSGKNSLM
jgi:Tfp pilus assembly protein PilO